MEQFKIRCSAIWQIMGNDRSGKNMGKTAQTYLETWVKEQLYNRKKEFYSQATGKGLSIENESIEFAAQQLGWGMVFKNEQHFENDFMTGTPDVILSNCIVDIKSSFDCFSFPLFDSDVEKSYWWQLQGYMILANKPNAKLVYCLMDTPLHIIEKQFYYKKSELGLIELEPEMEDEIIRINTYMGIKEKLRIKTYEIAKDPTAENAIKERVSLCREYINQLNY